MKQEIEIWKNIQGYENLYQISSNGRVKSLGNGNSNNSKERILKQGKNKYGYCVVKLCNEGKLKSFLVHRLVAQAFIPNVDNKPQIDHINTDRTDNRVENLRWVTNQENCNNPISKINYSIIQKGKPRLTLQKPILQFSKEGEFIKKWQSVTQVGDELNIHKGNIISCCKGKLNTCGGYIWRYTDDYEKLHFNIFDLNIYVKKVS